jgi:cytochrome c-type biogenesis protein CcmE
MRTRAKFLVGGVCVPVLFAILAVTTMGGSAEFVTPTDVDGTDRYDGQRVNLEGVVTNLSERTERLEFNVTDENASVPVVYEGQMPETMAEGRTVVAKGQYDGDVVRAGDLSVRAHEGDRPAASHGNHSENRTSTPANGTDLTPSETGTAIETSTTGEGGR